MTFTSGCVGKKLRMRFFANFRRQQHAIRRCGCPFASLALGPRSGGNYVESHRSMKKGRFLDIKKMGPPIRFVGKKMDFRNDMFLSRNDTYLDNGQEPDFSIITGPEYGRKKSTYMRQTAAESCSWHRLAAFVFPRMQQKIGTGRPDLYESRSFG